MESYILKENVLTDDVVHFSSENKTFKHGNVAIIESYSFKNAWSDKLKCHYFRKREKAVEFIKKNYPDFDIDLIGLI